MMECKPATHHSLLKFSQKKLEIENPTKIFIAKKRPSKFHILFLNQ